MAKVIFGAKENLKSAKKQLKDVCCREMKDGKIIVAKRPAK